MRLIGVVHREVAEHHAPALDAAVEHVHVAEEVHDERVRRVLEDLAGRTDLLDCQTHARSWDMLRLTRMPAVRVELGYLSNEADARRLTNPAFQDVVAEGLAVAVTRFCAPH